MDYNKITDWLNDQKFNSLLYQGWQPLTIQTVKEQFEHEKNHESAIHFAVCEKSSKKLVGWCGIFDFNKIVRKAEIRGFVAPEYWGKGYGLEEHAMLVMLGFERYNLNKIYCGTNAKNVGILRILDKLKITKEGTLRQDYFRDGRYYDVIRFSILHHEYEAKTKSICHKTIKNEKKERTEGIMPESIGKYARIFTVLTATKFRHLLTLSLFCLPSHTKQFPDTHVDSSFII